MDDIMAQAVSAIILLAITTFMPFVFKLAFALFRSGSDAVVGFLKTNLSAKQFAELQVAARMAVGFVEEASRNDSVRKASALKLAEAEATVDAYLKRRNLKFSSAEVTAAILDALHSARTEWEIQEGYAHQQGYLPPEAPPAEAVGEAVEVIQVAPEGGATMLGGGARGRSVV